LFRTDLCNILQAPSDHYNQHSDRVRTRHLVPILDWVLFVLLVWGISVDVSIDVLELFPVPLEDSLDGFPRNDRGLLHNAPIDNLVHINRKVPGRIHVQAETRRLEYSATKTTCR